MKKQSKPPTPAIRAQPRGVENLPSLILNAGDDAVTRFLEFFVASIRNKNTREAYARSIGQFLRFAEERGKSLFSIDPITVAAYIESHPGKPQTVKQHLAGIRKCFDFLVLGQILDKNPAHAVRGPKHVVKKGKTPVLSGKDTRKLLDSIDCTELIGLRDRALISLMVFSFGRISAVLGMNVEDFYKNQGRYWVRLHEKGGKFHEVPVHHEAEIAIKRYLSVAKIGGPKKTPLFQTMRGFSKELSGQRLHRTEALRMIKRRIKAVGLSDKVSCHSFRASGITAYLESGGSLENAQAIAAHESPRTTKLYDRRSERLAAEEIDRIKI